MILILFIKHSVCPKFTSIFCIDNLPQIWLFFLLVFSRSFIFQNWHNSLNYTKEYLPSNSMISGKNAAREECQRMEWTWQNFCPKIAEFCYSYIRCHNSILFNISTYFCFTKKAYLGSMILSKKVVIIENQQLE